VSRGGRTERKTLGRRQLHFFRDRGGHGGTNPSSTTGHKLADRLSCYLGQCSAVCTSPRGALQLEPNGPRAPKEASLYLGDAHLGRAPGGFPEGTEKLHIKKIPNSGIEGVKGSKGRGEGKKKRHGPSCGVGPACRKDSAMNIRKQAEKNRQAREGTRL